MSEGDDGQRRSTTFQPNSSRDEGEADAEATKDIINKITEPELEG